LGTSTDAFAGFALGLCGFGGVASIRFSVSLNLDSSFLVLVNVQAHDS
jgi:hypothetical protein